MNLLARNYEAAKGQVYPKLAEDKSSQFRIDRTFELANGRLLKTSRDSGGERFTLLDGEETIAVCYSYLDEERDLRTNITSFFSREDFPDWSGDQNPHLEVDFEVSRWGNLQDVKVGRYVVRFDKESTQWWSDRNKVDNIGFKVDSDTLKHALLRFREYAKHSLALGNKPDFRVLDEVLSTPLFQNVKIPSADTVTTKFDNFDI